MAIKHTRKKGYVHMASYNSGKMLSFHVPHGFATLFLWVSCFCVILPGCKTSNMSVQEAQDVAIEFQGTYKTVPPRGLGATIERSVAYYKEPPNVPEEYLVPQKQYTDADLKALHKGNSSGIRWDGSTFYRHLAFREYLLGNLSLAIRLIDLAPGKTRHAANKAIAFSYKAIFLAEAGDYKAAKSALSYADGSFRSNSRGRNLSAEWDRMAQAAVTWARAAINFARGDLHAAESEYRLLLREIDRARQLEQKVAMDNYFEPAARINLAKVLMSQGRLTEAEIYAREAIRYKHMNILPHCFIVLSDIFFEQGRFKDASICARTALHIAMTLRAPIDSFSRANAREIYARALLAVGQYKDSLAQYNLIERELKTDQETFNRKFKGSAEWGLALMLNGEIDKAIDTFEFSLIQRKKLFYTDPYTLAELEALHAMALAKSGKKKAALEKFDRNVSLMLINWQTKDGQSSTQNVRPFKFKLILEAYISLLAETNDPNQVEKSFLLASSLQDKIVGKAIALSSARAEVNDPELSDLIRQQQDLEIKLAALKNRLANVLYAPPELINNEVVESLQNEKATLNLAAITLKKEIRNRFPEYANIINPDDVSVVKVRNTLNENEALVSIFSGRKHTFVWAIPKDGSIALTKVPISKAEMAGIVDKLRKALNPGFVSTTMEIPPFDLDLAYQLFESSLKPVEAGWKQAKNLMVVTQGPIGQIPLAILPTTPNFKTKANKGKPIFSNYQGVDWLIKTHSVTVLPSISALVNLRSIKPKTTEMLAYAGFGDPFFNLDQLAEAQHEESRDNALLATRAAPIQVRGIRVTEAGGIDKGKMASIDISMLNRLPDTREEVTSIAATLQADTEKDVFVGKQASEQTVKSMNLSNRRVVVFATHGLVPGDLDGLDQPALALSAPDVTGDKENDGLLTMGEIMGLRLNADWVVLSACNTGAAEGEGAEAVSGLGQAFFYAGARSLLVTGWPVETVSAKLLTTDLFQRQLKNPNINRAEALRLTMNAMIAKNHNQGFSYSHPIFWAPYAIVGDGHR